MGGHNKGVPNQSDTKVKRSKNGTIKKSASAAVQQTKEVYKTITEGLVLETAKSAVMHASIWTAIYLMGYYNIGLFWILTPLLLTVVFEDDILKWLRSVPSENSATERTKILARAKDVPPWVFFPDFERAEWINKIIKNVWSNVEEMVIDAVVNSVDPLLEASQSPAPGIVKVSRVCLGDIPPRIGGVKVHPGNRTVSRDEIILEVEITWASDCNFEVVVNQSQDLVCFGVKDILVQGQLRVTLGPLLDEAPLVGGVRFSFIEEPHINFDLDGVASLIDLPGVSDLVKKLIASQVSGLLVLPNSIYIPLSEEGEEGRPASPCKMPSGMLRVQVIQALGLEAKDHTITGKSSDPYVIFSINGDSPEVKTEVIKRSLNPVWNKYGEFVVDRLDRDNLVINVWDWDVATKDDPLGSAEVPVSSIANRSGSDDNDFWVELEGVDTGKVRLWTKWFVPSTSSKDFEVSKAESLKKNGIFNTAVLLVHLDSCSNLHGVPSAYVQMTMTKQQPQESEVVQFAKNPVFRQNFRFLVCNPESDDLYLTVFDAGIKDDQERKSRPLGSLKVVVSNVMRRAGMEYLCQPWKLNSAHGCDDSNIVISLKLIFVKPYYQNILESESHFDTEEDEIQDRFGEMERSTSFAGGVNTPLTESMRSSSTASSLDGFTYGQAAYRPQVFMSFRYDKPFERLEVTVQSAQWIKIPVYYSGYVSLRLVPETKKDPKRKTTPVPLAETSSGGPSTTSQVYGGQLLFEDERFTYAKVSLSDLRTTCVEVKLKAIKTGSATAAAAACCNNGTPGTPGGSGTLGADSKRKTFRRRKSVFNKAVLIAQTTIPLAELNLLSDKEVSTEDHTSRKEKIHMFNLDLVKDRKARSLTLKSSRSTLGRLVLASQSSSSELLL